MLENKLDYHGVTDLFLKATTATISQLRAIFATHGIPELLVSDNESAFTSSEFEELMCLNGIRHSTSAPYHPATNGLAEVADFTGRTSIHLE